MKMTILAFTDQDMRTAADPSSYELQVNPAGIKYDKEVQRTSKGPIGGQYRAPKYSKHKEITLSFDTVFDATGAIDRPESDKATIDEKIAILEMVVYDINGKSHRPNYLKISWGGIIFQGVLGSLNYEYTLFSPEGLPLRAKISLSFTGYLCKTQAVALEGKSSPDLSHYITLKAGDSIAAICKDIYGDASYCVEVAKYNNLVDFRYVEPGTRIMFPPLD